MGLRNFGNFLLSLLLVCSLFFVFPAVRGIFVWCSSVLAVIWLCENLTVVTRRFFLRKNVPSKGKAVFITGCDSGFGHALTKRLDSLGYNVFAGCFDSKGDGATSLLKECSSRLRVLPLDVTTDDSVRAAKDFIVNNLGNNVLWAVVNNAGIPMGGEIEWTSMEDLQKVHEVNAIGTLRVTKSFLPMLRKSRGRLVNNTSACGDFICPGFVGYCMSKSAAIALTVGLRIEMIKWSVRVISIQPFFYRTPLTNADQAEKLIEQVWCRVDPHIRSEYGDEYKDNILRSSRLLLERGSSRIRDVIDCFEDAVTAEDPLDTYFPAKLADKLGIKLLRALPAVLVENYQRFYMERNVKPAVLVEDGKHSKNK